MNDFPAFALLVGFFGLLQASALLGRKSFRDLQADIAGSASPLLKVVLGAVFVFLAFLLYDYNIYGSSKSDIFGIPLVFLGNVFWAAIFLIPMEDSWISQKAKKLYSKICKK